MTAAERGDGSMVGAHRPTRTALTLTLLALLRRRLTLAILVALPVVFYLTQRDLVGRSLRALVFGLSWALATTALFGVYGARRLDPRLRRLGYPPRRLALGRVGAQAAGAVVLVAAFWVLVALDQPVRSIAAVGVDLAVTAIVAIALGTAIGTVIQRELDGVLAVFFFAGIQAVVNPFDRVAALLPLWSSRELGTWAVDGPEVGSLGDGLAHAVVVVAVCVAVATIVPRLAGGQVRR